MINNLESIKSLRCYFEEQTNVMITKNLVETDYYNTICAIHKIICHQQGILRFQGESGTNYFDNCECMNAEKISTVCGCGSIQHAHLHKILVQENIELIETLKEYSIDGQIFNSIGDSEK